MDEVQLMRLRASSKCAAATLPLLIALLACSSNGGADTKDGPYTAEILEAANNVNTDFERSVLEDGEITRAEYVEAARRYTDCVEEHGISISATDQFGLNMYTSGATTPENEKYLDTCTEGTIFVIEGLYSAIVKNPNNVDMKQLIVQCLVRSGLAPKDYSVDDYIADTPANEMATFPFDADDTRFTDCMLNPQTHL